MLWSAHDKFKQSTNNSETFTESKVNAGLGITVKDMTAIKYGDKVIATVTIKNADATGYLTVGIQNGESVRLPIVEGKVKVVKDLQYAKAF